MTDPVSSTVRSFGRLLTAARGPRLSILIFHRVLPMADPLQPGEPTADTFEARMRWLQGAFRVLPLVEAARQLRDGTLPPNAACVTFDDGYADNATIAAPILAKLRMTATFFVASGYLNGGRMWNDTIIESVRATTEMLDLSAIDAGSWSCVDDGARRATIGGLLDRLKYLPPDERQGKVDAIARIAGVSGRSALMMTDDQVRALRRYGMSIGAHTISHPILARITLDKARQEIADGRAALEAIVGEPVKVFAYPNGQPGRDYDASHVALVKSMQFDAAVSTAWGVSRRDSDRYQLPRFTPWDAGINRFGLRLAQNLLKTPAVAT